MDDQQFIDRVLAAAGATDGRANIRRAEAALNTAAEHVVQGVDYMRRYLRENTQTPSAEAGLGRLRAALPALGEWLTMCTGRQRDELLASFMRAAAVDGEFLASQLAALRAAVAAGVYESFAIDDQGRLVVVTKPVTIRHAGVTYDFGVYTIKLAVVGIDVDHISSYFALSNSRYTGDIHPHLNGSGGCFGTGGTPFIAAMRNRAWSDALSILDQLLRTYNERSPATCISNFSGGPNNGCGECGEAVAAADRVDIAGRPYHRACTVTSYRGAAVPAGQARTCSYCGRVCQITEFEDGSRHLCTVCAPQRRAEQTAAQAGLAQCHNCHATVPHSDIPTRMAVSARGDRVCDQCCSFVNGDVLIRTSNRWNSAQLVGTQFRSAGVWPLRGNAGGTAITTPTIQVPRNVVCTCGATHLSNVVTECRVAAATCCPTCDPHGRRVSRPVTTAPRLALPLVLGWINSNVPAPLLDFCQYISPASVPDDTLLTALYGVLNAPAQRPAGPTAGLVAFINRTLGYPVLTATTQVLEIYDQTFTQRRRS